MRARTVTRMRALRTHTHAHACTLQSDGTATQIRQIFKAAAGSNNEISIDEFIRRFAPPEVHIHIHTSMHACIHTYIHTHIHTHTHTHTHTSEREKRETERERRQITTVCIHSRLGASGAGGSSHAVNNGQGPGAACRRPCWCGSPKTARNIALSAHCYSLRGGSHAARRSHTDWVKGQSENARTHVHTYTHRHFQGEDTQVSSAHVALRRRTQHARAHAVQGHRQGQVSRRLREFCI